MLLCLHKVLINFKYVISKNVSRNLPWGICTYIKFVEKYEIGVPNWKNSEATPNILCFSPNHLQQRLWWRAMCIILMGMTWPKIFCIQLFDEIMNFQQFYFEMWKIEYLEINFINRYEIDLFEVMIVIIARLRDKWVIFISMNLLSFNEQLN